jgi:hypothetical protein
MRQTLFQRLAGRTYRSGPAGRLPLNGLSLQKVMPSGGDKLARSAEAFVAQTGSLSSLEAKRIGRWFLGLETHRF